MSKLSTNYSITELANLTHVTRPTFYTYYSNFEIGNLDKVPYSFIGLFELIEENASMIKIKNYCDLKFKKEIENDLLKEIIKNLEENVNKLDLEKINEYIKGEINNG